jgi:hypothetical protein
MLELVAVAYGPCPMPGSDASKKRKADAVGEAMEKRPKVPRKKKVETVKTSTSRGKIILKRPSDTEVVR